MSELSKPFKLTSAPIGLSIVAGLSNLGCSVFAWQPAYASNQTWTIDTEKSSVHFIARRGQHIPGRGKFIGLAGVVKYDGKDATKASVTVSLPVATITTGIGKRDSDLKSKLYFDCAHFPLATFKSKKISKSTDNKFLLVGDLQLHGVSRLLNVKMAQPKIETQKDGSKVLTAGGAAEIDQPDFALSLRKLHPDNVLVAENRVTIAIVIVAVPQGQRTKARAAR